MGGRQERRSKGCAEGQAADLAAAQDLICGVFDAHFPCSDLVWVFGVEGSPLGGIRAVDCAVGFVAVVGYDEEGDLDFLPEGIFDGDEETVISVGSGSQDLPLEFTATGAFKDGGYNALSDALIERTAEAWARFVGGDDAAAFDVG